jgi:hypothetical protein
LREGGREKATSPGRRPRPTARRRGGLVSRMLFSYQGEGKRISFRCASLRIHCYRKGICNVGGSRPIARRGRPRPPPPLALLPGVAIQRPNNPRHRVSPNPSPLRALLCKEAIGSSQVTSHREGPILSLQQKQKKSALSPFASSSRIPFWNYWCTMHCFTH